MASSEIKKTNWNGTTFYQAQCNFCGLASKSFKTEAAAKAALTRHNKTEAHKQNLRNKPKYDMSRSPRLVTETGRGISYGKQSNNAKEVEDFDVNAYSGNDSSLRNFRSRR
jgi:hypothetical protein